MEKEYINTIMEIYKMEIGNAESGKDGQLINILLVSMKENLKMAIWKEKEK